MTDLINEYVTKVFRETEPAKRPEAFEKFNNEYVTVQMKFFEDQIAKSGSGFIAASGFTWVDLYLYQVFDWNPKKDAILANFKHIKEARDKIEAMPGISNWLKTRPVTEM